MFEDIPAADDDVAFMGRLVGLVLDIPAEGVEERIREVDPYLGLGIALLEVVFFVLLELTDQRLNVLLERLKISHQSAPLTAQAKACGYQLLRYDNWHRISSLRGKDKRLLNVLNVLSV